jgi:hypothetical protein
MSDLTLCIATDFSPLPGFRYETQAPNSGERFREELLRPKFEQARRDGAKLEVQLDGVEGYTTSFLEEAFGGLARSPGIGPEMVMETIIVKSVQDDLIDDVHWYVKVSCMPVDQRPERPKPQRRAS